MNRILAPMALLLIGGPLAAHAQTTVFDTIDGYSQTNPAGALVGYFGGPQGPNATYVTGEEFTATTGGFISGLELTLFDPTDVGPGPSGIAINFGLYTNTSGGQAGNLIENLAVTMSGGVGTLATGSYQSGALLTTGQSYWLVSEGTTPAQWESTNAPDAPIVENEYANLQQPAGLSGGLYPGGSYTTTSVPLGLAVTVSGTVSAPEMDPASAVSGITLLLGTLVVLCRRSSRGSQGGGLSSN